MEEIIHVLILHHFHRKYLCTHVSPNPYFQHLKNDSTISCQSKSDGTLFERDMLLSRTCSPPTKVLHRGTLNPREDGVDVVEDQEKERVGSYLELRSIVDGLRKG
jgi:hypothetical protein